MDERKRILKAALDEFADMEFSDSSLESIAKRAEVETGVVRALFVDTKTLLGELLKEETSSLISATALVVEKIEDPKELIRKSLYHFNQWLFDHQKYVRIMLRCSLDRAGALQVLYQNSMMPSEFYGRLEQLVEEEKLNSNNLMHLSIVLDSLMLFPHIMRPAFELLNPEEPSEEFFENWFEAVMGLFENGLYSPKRK
jgi:AcrR family transcriptional regulator